VYFDYSGKNWRAPDDTCWRIYTASDNLPIWTLIRLVYNQDTGQWTAAEPQELHDVPQAELKAYTEVPEEPLRDPRITHLTSLVTALLTDYEAAIGTPAPNIEGIQAALTAVAAIPDESANREFSAWQHGMRQGHDSARRRR
jgi:hypothetical protein